MRFARTADHTTIGAWIHRAAATAMILAASLTLMGRTAAVRSLWFDEALTVGVARTPLSDLVDAIEVNGGNMAGYYVIMRPVVAVGDAEWFLRLPSVLCTVAAVAVFYVLAHRLRRREVATAATILLAANASVALFAWEVRSYAALTLAVVTAWLLLVRALERPSATRWTAFALVAGLALYLHLIAAAFLVAMLASLVALPRREVDWRGVFAAVTGIAVMGLPLVGSVLSADGATPDWIPELSLAQVKDVARFLAGTRGQPWWPAFAVAWLGGLAVILGTASRHGRGAAAWRGVVPVAWLVVPLVLVFLVSIERPLFHYRYFVAAVPAACLLAADAVMALGRRAGALAVGMLLVMATSGLLRPADQEDWRSLSKHLAARAASGDGVAFFPATARIPFDHYRVALDLDTDDLVPMRPPDAWSGVLRSYADASGARAAAVARQVRRVWMVVDFRWRLFPDDARATNDFLAAIDDSHSLAESVIFEQAIELRLYLPD